METVRNYWVAKLVTGNDDLLFKRVTARNYAITYAINQFYTLFMLDWISKYTNQQLLKSLRARGPNFCIKVIKIF